VKLVVCRLQLLRLASKLLLQSGSRRRHSLQVGAPLGTQLCLALYAYILLHITDTVGWLGDSKGRWPVKKLSDGLWKLCTYHSSSHHRHLSHP